MKVSLFRLCIVKPLVLRWKFETFFFKGRLDRKLKFIKLFPLRSQCTGSGGHCTYVTYGGFAMGDNGVRKVTLVNHKHRRKIVYAITAYYRTGSKFTYFAAVLKSYQFSDSIKFLRLKLRRDEWSQSGCHIFKWCTGSFNNARLSKSVSYASV